MKIITNLGIAVSLPFAAVFFYVLFGLTVGNVNISKYSGDGVISKKGSGFLNSGFEVVFDSFDLSKVYNSKYEVFGLPDDSDDYVIYFRIYDYDVEKYLKENKNTAIVKIEAISGGKSLFKIEDSLGSWTVTSLNPGETTDYYYLSRKLSSLIDPKNLNRNSMQLQLQYSPRNTSGNIAHLRGCLVLRSGGAL